MGADSSLLAEKAAMWAGIRLTGEQLARLTTYHDWLVSEAVKAGGIGPNEAGRIWSRHIADSLFFNIGLQRASLCADLGSGAGLPGVPLAITREDVQFELVDRSGRRCDLMRRAITVLGLDNCSVIHRDLSAVDKIFDSVVSRATLPPGRLMIHVKRLLVPGWIAIVGLSRGQDVREGPTVPEGWSTEVVSVPADILDTSVKLLRIVAA
jgi:16S rRNA (guanine527-N7)-methyltransferase